MGSYSVYSTKREITELHYNYRQACSDGKDIYSEDWNTATIGISGVVSIHEHNAAGEGDKWFYDIVYNDNTVIRTFNPCRVFYKIIE